MFDDLPVVSLGARASLQPIMGFILNPSVALKNITTMRNPPIRDILSGFEGVVMPGEMLCESRLFYTRSPLF
jgi:ATP-binding cassette subfamily G (WHITE) protein 2 (SNQ2)